MKTARVLLLASVAAAAGASVPGRMWSQRPTPYVIDVAKPDSVMGRRFNMRQRVRVEVRDLNPFAGNYRVVVNEKAYSDSAITQFLAGLGITVPSSAPQTKQVGVAQIGAAMVGASVRELLRPEWQPAAHCDSICTSIERTAHSVVNRFYALQDTLRSLDSQDADVRLLFGTVVTSERSDSKSVMAALDSVIDMVQQRVARLHDGRTYLQAATEIVSDADDVRRRLDACPCAESERSALDSIKAKASDLSIWARWRDSLMLQAEKDLPALRTASSQASKMFVQVFEVGDYDYPTTVDIAVQRQPLGPVNFAALTGQVGEVTGSAAAPPTGPNAPATVAADSSWRTIANPRLSFGERRRIGLSGALVLGMGPQVSTYGTARTTPRDSALRITETRREPPWTPLLTLTTRIWAGECWLRMVCAANVHLGVSPSLTTRQTYFLGLGFAFADERVGIMVGALSLPVQVLQPGLSVGDSLNPLQASPPTQDGREWRLALGLNLRPF